MTIAIKSTRNGDENISSNLRSWGMLKKSSGVWITMVYCCERLYNIRAENVFLRILHETELFLDDFNDNMRFVSGH